MSDQLINTQHAVLEDKLPRLDFKLVEGRPFTRTLKVFSENELGAKSAVDISSDSFSLDFMSDNDFVLLSKPLVVANNEVALSLTHQEVPNNTVCISLIRNNQMMTQGVVKIKECR